PHGRLPATRAGGRLAGHHRRLSRLGRSTHLHRLRSLMRKSLLVVVLVSASRSFTPSPPVEFSHAQVLARRRSRRCLLEEERAPFAAPGRPRDVQPRAGLAPSPLT